MGDSPGSQHPLPFSNDARIREIAGVIGTPLFVHDEASYRRTGREALEAPNAFGLTVRYAMKANSHRAILRIFDDMGIHIDASSHYEVLRALAAGIVAERVQLTSQEVQTRDRLREIVERGVLVNASSLEQLRVYAQVFPRDARPFGIRVNPGLGSGHNNRTNTGGPAASFGIWREYLGEAEEIAREAGLRISRLHTHVGSGSDWRVWQRAAEMALAIARRLPDVEVVNLGGGYKIDRMRPEESIDLKSAFAPVKKAFEDFARETGRRLRLEIEPGTYLAANSCILVARVVDAVDTGREGYHFLKIDASMTELLRPMIYGAKHPIRLIGKGTPPLRSYVVVGLCCESGDVFTTREGNPEEIDTVDLPEAARGDLVAVLGAGAYGIAMSSKYYNSRPMCAEVMIASDGSYRLITGAQEPADVYARELD
jgi:diaminopimelate decarboxylase